MQLPDDFNSVPVLSCTLILLMHWVGHARGPLESLGCRVGLVNLIQILRLFAKGGSCEATVHARGSTPLILPVLEQVVDLLERLERDEVVLHHLAHLVNLLRHFIIPW